MKRLSFALLALLALFVTLLAACSQPAPAAQPTAAPTQPAANAAQPAASGMAITGTVTLWHAYGTGSAEEKAINILIDRARAAYPQATINVLQIPFDQIFNKFNNEVSSGGGPDMFIAPNDSLGSQIRAGVLADLSEYQSMLTDIDPKGIAGMSLNGRLYGIPESFKAVALYYNKSKITNPPATTDELLALVKAGKTLVLNQNAYHNFGWLQAFGGQLMDNTGKCIADQAGGPEWFAYLKALKEVPTVTFSTDGGQADSLFKDGKADMIINGPWVLGDYRAVLGDNLGVAPMPGAIKPAGPLTGVDGFYVSINSQNVVGAVALAMFLTSPESMQVYVDEAGHVPVSTKVQITDPLVQAFAQASATGVPRPQIPELDNYWGPFGDAMTKVLDGGADPKAAVTEACALMNTANGK